MNQPGALIFIDTLYLVARLNPRDQWHDAAKRATAALGPAQFVTTESVLVELLNFFAEFPPAMRQTTAEAVLEILADPAIETIPQTHELFLAALEFYVARRDKAYSHTACFSMLAMRARGITAVLSHDHHFAQEGFQLLL